MYTITLFTMPPMFFLISLLSSIFTATFFTHSYSRCLGHQKNLLLELKNELMFDPDRSKKLVQWNQTDECCNWHGVDCDAAGYVISLQLDRQGILGAFRNSSSLFRFKYLEKLNLAYNHIIYMTNIPREIQNLRYLTHLNLSHSISFGQVPLELSMLRRLVSLDICISPFDYYTLDQYTIPPKLEYPNLEMFVQNLTRLRELYLDGAYFSPDHDRRAWSHIVSSYLPNLRSLSLRHCNLSGPLHSSFRQLSISILQLDGNDLSTVIPEMFSNFSSLTTLSLHDCSLKGYFPKMIFQMPTLQDLDLSENYLLRGTIPPFSQNGSLKSIVLRNTNFSGSIPSSISNLKTLSNIDLSLCKFTGPVPSTFSNLTQLNQVNLSSNLFTGSLSFTLFGGLSNLVSIDLNSNQLEGPIPYSFFQLQSLECLDLSHNMFNGTFQGIANLPELSVLDVSDNRIAGEVPSWIWGRQLVELNLSHNLLTHLQKPYHIPAFLQVLDLESNQLRGELHLPILPTIDDLTSDLWFVSVANNSLSGSIPTFLCNASLLEVLHLSLNIFSGNIPLCLLENTLNLKVLDLGRNNISGRIPNKFPLDCSLRYLDLNNNTLGGKLPKSLERCLQLEFMNVGNNIINDTFPCMLSSSLRVLVLHSNRFQGEVKCHKSWPDLQIVDMSSNNFSGTLEYINFSSWWPMDLDRFEQLSPENSEYYFSVSLVIKGIVMELVTIWPNFATIDFSCNNFHGEIPNAIGDLSFIHLLNLSHNALNGSIPKSFGNLTQLESLDLSENNLRGTIPEELARLTFLSVLNLSYNKLTGVIPSGRQFQTFSADSFQGNSGLCGFPLNRSCSSENKISPPKQENVHLKKEIEWEYVSAALGYVVGLGSIVWLLLFCRSFREKYFDKVEEVVAEIFDRRNRRRRRARRVVTNQVRR